MEVPLVEPASPQAPSPSVANQTPVIKTTQVIREALNPQATSPSVMNPGVASNPTIPNMVRTEPISNGQVPTGTVNGVV